MKTQKSLSVEEWAFFEAVSRASFTNPFGKTRDELDLLIGGSTSGASPDEILAAVYARVQDCVTSLRRSGKAELRYYEGNRREVVKTVFLFHLFHRYVENFDSLIQAQIRSGDAPCRVTFSREVLKNICGFGISEQEAERIFAVYYQLRRAFYFIRNGLVGSSPAMRTLRKHLWNCVFTHDIRWFESRLWKRMEDFPVLLLGETGTGKGAAAAAIGKSGFIPFDADRNCFAESFTRNFVAINLSQYSEGVLESELFGHRKGAFTGAVENHEGLFSRCAPHGVIFLDEIGDVSVPVQIKLLHVLQERIFFPVGSHEAKRFSGRVIAATNRPLDLLISEGKFRDDFYYRLCTDEITLPPLRQRLQEEPGELDLLLSSILTRLTDDISSREQQLVKKILERDIGKDYPWSGNVRELEQAVKRIILTGHYHGKKATRHDPGEVSGLAEAIVAGAMTAESLLSTYCTSLYKRFGTYEEVARRTQLDRRTVKKYVQTIGEG